MGLGGRGAGILWSFALVYKICREVLDEQAGVQDEVEGISEGGGGAVRGEGGGHALGSHVCVL